MCDRVVLGILSVLLPWFSSYPKQLPDPSLSTWGKWGPAAVPRDGWG